MENHPADSRVKLSGDNMCQTLTSRMGTGGGNIPLVMEKTKCYDVRFTSEGTKNARQNCYETETARTIDTGGNAPIPIRAVSLSYMASVPKTATP